MRELTKHAVETLYRDDLKQRLEYAFGTLMAEIKELPDGIYGQYATNALKNLIQLSARGVTDLNVLITEYLNDSDVLYANYEAAFQKIKSLDEIALVKKFDQDTYFENYAQKSLEYNRLRKEYYEEKGIEDSTISKDLLQAEQAEHDMVLQGKVGINQERIGIDQEKIGINQERIGIDQERIGINQERMGIDQERIGINQERIGSDDGSRKSS